MILKNHPGHSINTWTGEVARLEVGKTIRTFCARSGEQGLRPTGRKRNRLSICCQPVSPNSCWRLFFFFKFLFISVLGLQGCTQAFSSCSKLASHCSGFSCCKAQDLDRGLDRCSSQAWGPHGMGHPPKAGIEPMSPALAGGS